MCESSSARPSQEFAYLETRFPGAAQRETLRSRPGSVTGRGGPGLAAHRDARKMKELGRPLCVSRCAASGTRVCLFLWAAAGGLQQVTRRGISPLNERTELKLANLPLLRRLRTACDDQAVHLLLHRVTLPSPVLKRIAGHHTLPLRKYSDSTDVGDVSSNLGLIVAARASWACRRLIKIACPSCVRHMPGRETACNNGR